MAAATGLEPAHTRLQDESSACQLSYAASEKFGGLEESRTLTRSLQDYDAARYITSPEWKIIAEARIELAPSGL